MNALVRYTPMMIVVVVVQWKEIITVQRRKRREESAESVFNLCSLQSAAFLIATLKSLLDPPFSY